MLDGDDDIGVVIMSGSNITQVGDSSSASSTTIRTLLLCVGYLQIVTFVLGNAISVFVLRQILPKRRSLYICIALIVVSCVAALWTDLFSGITIVSQGHVHLLKPNTGLTRCWCFMRSLNSAMLPCLVCWMGVANLMAHMSFTLTSTVLLPLSYGLVKIILLIFEYTIASGVGYSLGYMCFLQHEEFPGGVRGETYFHIFTVGLPYLVWWLLSVIALKVNFDYPFDGTQDLQEVRDTKLINMLLGSFLLLEVPSTLEHLVMFFILSLSLPRPRFMFLPEYTIAFEVILAVKLLFIPLIWVIASKICTRICIPTVPQKKQSKAGTSLVRPKDDVSSDTIPLNPVGASNL